MHDCRRCGAATFHPNTLMRPMRKLSFALALLLAPAALVAQAGFTPSFQPTRVAEREYNFAIADYNGGTALVMQWREGLGNPKLQFTGELGFADSDGPVNNDGALIIGGSVHYQLNRASSDLPFDMVFGAGIGVTSGEGYSIFRIPVGVAIGHRFPLEGNLAITPFVHPRLALDRLSAGGNSDTDVNLDIDIGGSFELNNRMQIRLVATLGNADAVGIGFVWTPQGLRR